MSNNIVDKNVSDKVVWENGVTPDNDYSQTVSQPQPSFQPLPQSQMMFCYKCNNVIPENSRYCPYCKVELYATCPKCGLKYSSQYPICNQCGTNRQEYLELQKKEQERIERRKRIERNKQEELERQKQEKDRQEKLDKAKEKARVAQQKEEYLNQYRFLAIETEQLHELKDMYFLRLSAVGRTKEINRLDQCMKEERPQLVIVYGRRRVGKTYLINQYFEGRFDFKMTGIYQAKKEIQLKNFATELNRQTKQEHPQVSKQDFQKPLLSPMELLR